MTIHFPDTTLHRYACVETPGGVYGETITTYQYQDDIRCDFQNETNQEIAEQYGIELSDLYKVYVDLNTTVNSSDLFSDDENNTYDIIGGIKVYRKFHKYKKIILRRRRTHEYQMENEDQPVSP